jgi:hypothetical protein
MRFKALCQEEEFDALLVDGEGRSRTLYESFR